MTVPLGGREADVDASFEHKACILQRTRTLNWDTAAGFLHALAKTTQVKRRAQWWRRKSLLIPKGGRSKQALCHLCLERMGLNLANCDVISGHSGVSRPSVAVVPVHALNNQLTLQRDVHPVPISVDSHSAVAHPVLYNCHSHNSKNVNRATPCMVKKLQFQHVKSSRTSNST